MYFKCDMKLVIIEGKVSPMEQVLVCTWWEMVRHWIAVQVDIGISIKEQ